MDKGMELDKTAIREPLRQVPIVAPATPERETPRTLAENAEHETPEKENRQHPLSEPGDDADEDLNLILREITAYFNQRATMHDLETISFTLRHLFSRVDFLYRQALPELGQWTSRKEKGKEMLAHQQVWLHLQTINRTLDRMAPLCHLLSDVIECLLDSLDNEEVWVRTFEEEETLLLKQVHPLEKHEQSARTHHATDAKEPAAIEPESWERAVTMLMDRLLLWQEQHHKLTAFHKQFTHPSLTGAHLERLDSAFSVLLDSAGAIFGDILPNFRLVDREEKEEIGALLFDLMQQSDQMLVQFESTLEPLTGLLRHFAALSENG